MSYQTIEIEKSWTTTVWLNRPKIHNAFNEVMIQELSQAFDELEKDDSVGTIVLRGRGKSFCAGADLNWMKSVVDYSYEQNYQESLNLANCFYKIYTCSKPTIAMVHGAAIGGANGLLASCDMAYAEEETIFSLSEVKIGIVPACISPYVIKRVGEYPAKELMLTGKRIQGEEAERVGLVNKSLSAYELEQYVENILKHLQTSGPKAMTQCKELIYRVTNEMSLAKAIPYTAEMIATIRASDEGQEGMKAFLEKRKPNF
jgi:methylglutaconyl-CoA hydratase